MWTRKTLIPLITFFLLLCAGPVFSSSPLPVTKTGHYVSNLQYNGGEGTGYTLEQVRWGDHRNFERIVFEFSPPGPERDVILPRMRLEIEYYPLRMAIRLPGSDQRRDEIFTSPEPFRKSRLITRVDSIDVCGGGQYLTIIPARPVEYEVFSLTSPPRLVIDVIMSRMDPIAEQKKLSLRTFPLHGDQVCIFLDQAAEAGVTPRLLTDTAGNVFGEIELYDDPDEAFTSLQNYRTTIGKSFALTIEARGTTEIPGVMP
jgi:hypothetical protein